MLKKLFKNTIITLIQIVLLVFIGNMLGQYLLDNPENLKHWRDFFNNSKLWFLALHAGFYILLYLLWPYLLRLLFFKQMQTTAAVAIQKAITARVYLIALFILFELLFYVRS